MRREITPTEPLLTFEVRLKARDEIPARIGIGPPCSSHTVEFIVYLPR